MAPMLILLLNFGVSIIPLVQASVPQALTPVMGFSTWNYFALNFSDSVIREIVTSMADNGLLQAGYRFINIDDGWGAYDRDPSTQEIIPDPDKFPYGMQNLSSFVHSLGFSFGLYTSRANRTCTNQMPGSLGFELLDAQTFASFGADFLKNDDCNTIYAQAYPNYLKMEEAIQGLARPLLHNVKAPDLSPSEALQVSQSKRVGKDIKNTWEDMVRVLDTGTDPSFSAIAGHNYFNDFDMLEIGNPPESPSEPSMTLIEWQSHFSLWAVMKSPLVLGNDPRNISAEVMSIITNPEVIAVNQDPLRVQATKLSSTSVGLLSSTTKVYLSACPAQGSSESVDLRRAQWNVVENEGYVQITSALDESFCLEVYQCQVLWPFWISISQCNTTIPSCPADTDHQKWILGPDSQGEATNITLQSFLKKCWPGQGGASNSSDCCLSSEGANVEVEKCGWMLNNTGKQQWTLTPEKFLVNSLMNQCLTVAGDLEVYGGPVHGGYTAVLFNRSPQEEVVTLSFETLGLPPNTSLAVRDILEHVPLPVAQGSFSALVPPHAVAHVVLTPASS